MQDAPEPHPRRPGISWLFLLVIAQACGSGDSPVENASAPVEPESNVAAIEGPWLLESAVMDGEPYVFPPEAGPADAGRGWVQFEDGGRMQGNGTCNQFRGSYQFDGHRLTVMDVYSTAKACGYDESRLMEAEAVFIDVLWTGQAGVEFSNDNKTMTWSAADTILRFRRSEVEFAPALPPPPEPVTLDDVSDAEIELQVRTWVNMTGLGETDVAVWRERLSRACTFGVWDEPMGFVEEFVSDDPQVPDGAMVDEELDDQAALALWIMAVDVCGDQFPEGAVEKGPPGNEPDPERG